MLLSFFTLYHFAYSESSTNLDSKAMYDNKELVLDQNTKNFVIIIPNEAHESVNQPKNQLPLANQPYLPQNLVIKQGTKVFWYNADVGHTHKISLFDDKLQNVFSANTFDFNFESTPYEPTKTGVYTYEEKDVNEIDTAFVMNGTITVEDNKTGENTNSTGSNYTVGTFMVPKKLLTDYENEFKNNGINFVSTYSFKDIRGGQKGTGPEQSYVVWSTGEQELDKVLKFLKDVTPKLPYN